MKKLLIVTAVSALFLTACGGSKSKSNSQDGEIELPTSEYTLEEIREHWDVPLMPQKSHPDYYTVKGVDEGGVEGARDDWEIQNALASYPNKDEYKLLNMTAVIHNKIVDAYEAKDDSKLLEEFKNDSLNSFCYSAFYDYTNDYLLIEPMRDTELREENYHRWGTYMNVLIDENFKLPTYDVLERECPKLLK